MADVFFTGSSDLGVALDHVIARADAAARTGLLELAETEKREAASGAPHRSGHLAGSYVIDGPHAEGFGAYVVSVGPTVIYGRRVEQGFHGTDSLGRRYDQAGQPSLAPAHARAEARAGSVLSTRWAMAMATG